MNLGTVCCLPGTKAANTRRPVSGQFGSSQLLDISDAPPRAKPRPSPQWGPAWLPRTYSKRPDALRLPRRRRAARENAANIIEAFKKTSIGAVRQAIKSAKSGASGANHHSPSPNPTRPQHASSTADSTRAAPQTAALIPPTVSPAATRLPRRPERSPHPERRAQASYVVPSPSLLRSLRV